MRRFFNTAGTCDPRRHYILPAVDRLPEIPRIVEEEGYAVLHAPRQTGKTTTIRALAREITAEGRFAATYVDCQAASGAGEDAAEAELALLGSVRRGASLFLPPGCLPPDPWPEAPPLGRLLEGLTLWAQRCPRPLVVFIDEIDALVGRSLISVLRQLRQGHPDRPHNFPSSVVLCGLRDVRDYKAASGGNPSTLGSSSPFNIAVQSLRLGDFTEQEVQTLLLQHSEATGQLWTGEALGSVWRYAQGQPWLTNALANEVVTKQAPIRSDPILASHVDEAKEQLILARRTHLDSLVDKLHDERVRRVIEPMMAGGTDAGGIEYDDDSSYVRDLGLIALSRPARIANPIYREVIARVLSAGAEDKIQADPRSYILSDGRLDIHRFLTEFILFWKQHGDVLAAGMPYHEVAPQLVLMAFLQRVVNGGGYVDREFGVGRGRIDLLVRWPWKDSTGKRVEQREALELKVWREGRRDPLAEGLTQIDGYLASLSLDTGILVIFDRRVGIAEAADRTVLSAETTPSGRVVTLLRA